MSLQAAPSRSLLAPLRWPAFLEQREQRRQAALAAARALAAKDPGPAGHLLRTWRFSHQPELLKAALDRLLRSPPRPPPGHEAALLAPADALRCPAPSADAAEHLLQAHLFHRTRPDEASSANPLAWALSALSWTGAQVELRERQAWQVQRFVTDPERDLRTRRLWRHFLDGQLWEARKPFESLFLSEARRAFRAALTCRQVPVPERRAYLEELEETLFWYMIGGSKQTPGWQELAVRLVEQPANGETGPVDALARELHEPGWRRVSGCSLSASDTWRDTAAAAFPDLPGIHAARVAFRKRARTDPGWLEAMLDLAVVLRLLHRWQIESPRTHPDEDWNLVIRHRSRARGRLRAVILDEVPEALARAVARPEGLFARTAAAVRIYAWARACEVLHRHQLPAFEDPLTAPCEPAVAELQTLDLERSRALRAWLLLVVLRDRWDQLIHWAGTGQWRRRPDSAWGRLLSEDLPLILQDPGGGYRDLQVELALHLPEHGEALRRQLQILAGADREGTLKERFQELLDPFWHPDVPRPQRFQQGFAARIQATLALLEPR